MSKLTNKYILTEEITEEEGKKYRGNYYKKSILWGPMTINDHPYLHYLSYSGTKSRITKLESKLKNESDPDKRKILKDKILKSQADLRTYEAKFRRSFRKYERARSQK